MDERLESSFESRLEGVASPYARGAWRAFQVHAVSQVTEEDLDALVTRLLAEESPTAHLMVLELMQSEPTHPTGQLVVAESWLRLEPDDPSAQNTASWMLLTVPEEARRDPVRALALVDRALAQLEGRTEEELVEEADQMRPAFLDTRAEALRQLDRLDEALDDQRRAVELARKHDVGQLDEMESRLLVLEALSEQTP